jgi:hypothetical protein
MNVPVSVPLNRNDLETLFSRTAVKSVTKAVIYYYNPTIYKPCVNEKCIFLFMGSTNKYLKCYLDAILKHHYLTRKGKLTDSTHKTFDIFHKCYIHFKKILTIPFLVFAGQSSLPFFETMFKSFVTQVCTSFVQKLIKR